MENGRRPPKNVVLDAIYALYGSGLEFEARLERALLTARHHYSPGVGQLASALTVHRETMAALRTAQEILTPRPPWLEAAIAAQEEVPAPSDGSATAAPEAAPETSAG